MKKLHDFVGMFFGLTARDGSQREIYQIININENYEVLGFLLESSRAEDGPFVFEQRRIENTNIFDSIDKVRQHLDEFAEIQKNKKQEEEKNVSGNPFNLDEALAELTVRH